MKAPKNFYNAVDQMKLGIDQIEDIKKKVNSIISLPIVTLDDAGKTVVVSDQGEWKLGTINRNSFWDEYDNIIRRPGYSSLLSHYNALKTMTFTGVPSDCTRVLVQSYYSNYIVHFLRESDTLTPDNAHHIPFGEWYRTNSFTPSDNSSQAVTLHQTEPSSYIPLPGATDYGTDVVINMNSFQIIENDTVVVPINCEYSDFNTTAPI